MTPEGRMKQLINAVLVKHKCWYFMPVPTGFQAKTIDYIVCCKSNFIVIEAKAPGKHPTSRQDYILKLVRDAGGLTFVVNSVETLKALDDALENL
jgi:hypothetical protein